MSKFDDQILEYRKELIALQQQMQSEYDKAIMALSGGALGVSMTFLNDVVVKQGIHGGEFLLIAWISWGLSVSCILFSFLTSTYAFRRAVQQTDDQVIYLQLAGGVLDKVTHCLNIAAGMLFFVGVVFIVAFTYCNLP